MIIRIETTLDKVLEETIRQGLKDNDGYCPCKLLHEPENKCMCEDFRLKIEKKEAGSCGCGLYNLIVKE